MKTKDKRIAALQKRSEKANKVLKAHTWGSLLSPGRHSFRVKFAEWKKDIKRDYDYLYVLLWSCDIKISDRFPLTDQMTWKLGDFLDSIGSSLDELKDNPKNLVGKTGALIAEKIGSGRIAYKYQKAGYG